VTTPPPVEHETPEWRPKRRAQHAVASVAGWCGVTLVAAVAGALAVTNRKVGLGLAGAVLVLGIFAADPLLFVVIALPGVLLLQRAGGASTNVSVADILVFVAGVVSLFYVRWNHTHHLRQFMRGVIWYQAILILVVIAHPFRADVVEWFHRFSYLGASALAGWVIAYYGRTKQAVRAFLVAAGVLGIITMAVGVSLHFSPAQFGAYQKNAIGGVMWVAIVVAQLNPPWMGISRRLARASKYLCIGGLLASQSRQSAILLVLALVAALFFNPDFRRRGKIIILASIPVVVLLYYSFSYAARNNPKFNSVAIRVDQIGAAVHVWHLSPIFGEGMRFYYLPQYITVTAPPNVIIDNLASTGILGSLAFVFLVVVTMRAMYRLPYAIGTLGFVLLLGHYVGGLFDIFWLGGPTVGPLIFAGICLGLADLERAKEPEAVGEPVVRPARRWKALASARPAL
jgi:hypothetical protein